MKAYTLKGHFIEILNGLTQLLNAVLGSCDANQSFSERSFLGRALSRGLWPFWYRFVNTLFFWADDHCYEAHRAELLRMKRKLESFGVSVGSLEDAKYWDWKDEPNKAGIQTRDISGSTSRDSTSCDYSG